MHHASRGRNGLFCSRIALSLALLTVASPAAFADTTGYTGIFGGGPIYMNKKGNIDELAKSGFSEITVWNMQVKANGDLDFNGEFPIVSKGVYIGDKSYPDFAKNIAMLKQSGVKRITFSIGSSNYGDFQDINTLVRKVGVNGGTGTDGVLYKNFKALKAAIPSIDAIDLDDENGFDADATVAFSIMLGELGYHVIPDVYSRSDYWKDVVKRVNAARPGTVDGVHLQAYAGGLGNEPCNDEKTWDFGGIPVYPGIAASAVEWDGVSAAGAKTQIADWQKKCGISGAWLWIYDGVAGKDNVKGKDAAGPAAYAKAMNEGLVPQTPADRHEK